MLCIIENHKIQRNIYWFTKQILGSTYSIIFQSNNLKIHTQKEEKNFTNVNKENKKFLKIAILGAPNAGKSTLVNQLIKRSVCPTSAKVHTTQTKTDAVYCQNETQLVFIDTPGLITSHEYNKYKLDNTFKNDPKQSMKAADVVGVIQDVGNKWTRGTISKNIVELLQEARKDVPLLLILNKVDQVKKKHLLLSLVRKFTNQDFQLKFNDVFMVSALTGDGVQDLRNYLLDCAKHQDWQYERTVYTDQTPETIIVKTVRANLMNSLPNEVPYKLKIQLEHFEICPDKSVSTSVTVYCPTKRICRLIISKNGRRIKEIAEACEQQMQHAFRTPVRLKLCISEPKEK